MREAGKVEGFRAALPATSAALDCIASELQYSGFRLVEREPELAQTLSQAIEKRPSILGELEAHNAVVRISDDDHIPLGFAPSPPMCPQVENVMQVNIGKQQRRNDPLNAKGNFRFERAVTGWRANAVVDLRRKR